MMLTENEYAALTDILDRHVKGRLSPAEAFALITILAKIAPLVDQNTETTQDTKAA